MSAGLRVSSQSPENFSPLAGRPAPRLQPFGGVEQVGDDSGPDQDHAGARFQHGPATAMGLMVVSTTAGATKSFQWTEGILLVGK